MNVNVNAVCGYKNAMKEKKKRCLMDWVRFVKGTLDRVVVGSSSRKSRMKQRKGVESVRRRTGAVN